MRKLLALSGLIVLMAATSTALASSTNSTASKNNITVHSLRTAIEWHIQKTWYWQDKGNVPRTPTDYAFRHTKSKAYLGWSDRTWRHRQSVARHHTLTRPAIPYMSLWLCIHHYEGAWNDHNSGHNGHYGGLQMTSPWGRGEYYVNRADYLTPYEQMYKAYLGFKDNGFSIAWLKQQWYHPDCIANYG